MGGESLAVMVGTRRPRSRWQSAAVVVGGLSVASVVFGLWELTAVLLAVCLAVRLGGRTGLVAAVPASVVLVIAGALVLAELLGFVRWPVLAGTWGSRTVLAGAGLLCAVAAARAWRRSTPGRAILQGPVTLRPLLAAAIPAMVLAAFGVLSLALPPEQQVQWFLEGDNPRHLIYVADVWQTGHLDYALDSYPKAWHSLLALLWGSTGAAALDADGLMSLLELNAASTWFLYVTLTLVTGLLADALAKRMQLSMPWRSVAALCAAASTLSVPFLGVYMANGFEASILQAVLLGVTAHELVAHPGTGRSLVVTAAGVAVTANNWQLMLPETLFAFAVAVFLFVRAGGSKGVAVCAGAAAALVSAPGLLTVVVQTGLGHAEEAGVVAPLPMGWLVATVLAAALVLWLRRGDLPVVAMALMVLGAVASAFGVAAVLGIPATQYYPSKVLWKATTLGIPLVWVMLAWVVNRRPAPARRSVLVAGGGVVALLCLWWLAQPLASLSGKWSSVDAERVLATLRSADASSAQVVWTGDREDDTIARILLDFYRVGETRDRTVQHPLSVAEECLLLRAAARPAVLSTETMAAVRARYSCVPDLRVVVVQAAGDEGTHPRN